MDVESLALILHTTNEWKKDPALPKTLSKDDVISVSIPSKMMANSMQHRSRIHHKSIIHARIWSRALFWCRVAPWTVPGSFLDRSLMQQRYISSEHVARDAFWISLQSEMALKSSLGGKIGARTEHVTILKRKLMMSRFVHNSWLPY